MTGPEFKAWRESFDLTQADVAAKFQVSRTTVQNWEACPAALPPALETGVRVWTRRLRQEDPGRGPVTLNYSNGPLFIQPFGPRRPTAMLQQEVHLSNAAVLARAAMLASNDQVFNPFVLEDGAHDLWNIVELQRVVAGEDKTAPTLPNLLRRLADGIRADAPYFVRNGARTATPAEVDQRARDLNALAVSLERIAYQTVLEIVGEQSTCEAILAQVRVLGVRPRDALVNAIAQAFVAARMPTANFQTQTY